MADFDTVIIGSGAGGATVAKRLVDKGGKRVLVIDRGTAVPQEDANWDPKKIFLEKGYQTDEKWLDGNDETFSPEAYYVLGGNTKFYGAVLQRMREEDFSELRHLGGISPSWPIGYDAFEPYYTEAEKIFKIHAKLGEDPTEPWHSGPFPHEEMPHEPRIQEISDELAKDGFEPFHAPLALDRNVKNPGEGKCIRCQTCDPYPCKLHAKMDAETACLIPALQSGEASLWADTQVLKLETDSSGKRVTAAIVSRSGGGEERVTAERFVLSAGAINSAALLLRSANSVHPHGLGNRSGLLGRRLMFHNHSGITAINKKPNDTVFQKTLALHDYYFAKAGRNDYPLGAIQLTGKAPWERLASTSDLDMPEEMLKHMARHSVDWWMTTEDLPVTDNRVVLGSNGEVKINFRPNNMQAHDEMIATWIGQLRRLGDELFMTQTMPLETVWHQAGTCLFGVDESKSVLDLQCRVWELDNCHVVDASFLPSMGAVNPTLTIIANALRVGDYLAGLQNTQNKPDLDAIAPENANDGLESAIKTSREMRPKDLPENPYESV